MSTKIAITGATGQLGQRIVKKLKETIAPENIIALARSPQKAEGLGVETREADYDKPETLDAALKGVDTLMFVSASVIGQRAPQHQNIIDAAKKNDIKWIVYTSLLHANTSPISLAEEHRFTEDLIKKSGIPYTILRNGWYTENYTGAVNAAIAGGALYGSAGDGKISSATRDDFADAAVAVLTGEGHEGKVYELAGDESYTLSDLAAELSRQTGKDIPYKSLTEQEYAALLTKMGVPEGVAQTLAAWDVDASKGALYHEGNHLSTLIGRKTTPLSEAVAEALRQM